jgi:hypothetical protein
VVDAGWLVVVVDARVVLDVPEVVVVGAVVTLITAISWLPRLKDTRVPVPVWPLYISFQLYEPDPRPGTSAKLTARVAAPLAATRPMTTPSLSWPAQYG